MWFVVDSCQDCRVLAACVGYAPRQAGTSPLPGALHGRHHRSDPLLGQGPPLDHDVPPVRDLGSVAAAALSVPDGLPRLLDRGVRDLSVRRGGGGDLRSVPRGPARGPGDLHRAPARDQPLHRRHPRLLARHGRDVPALRRAFARLRIRLRPDAGAHQLDLPRPHPRPRSRLRTDQGLGYGRLDRRGHLHGAVPSSNLDAGSGRAGAGRHDPRDRRRPGDGLAQGGRCESGARRDRDRRGGHRAGAGECGRRHRAEHLGSGAGIRSQRLRSVRGGSRQG